MGQADGPDPMISAVFNAIMLAADVALVRRMARLRGFPWGWFVAQALAAGALAVVLGEDAFGVMRLLAFAVFVHLPAIGIAAAALLRRHARRTAAAGAGLAALVLAIAVDAFVIEPRALEVNRHSVKSARVRRPLRIVVLADLQMDSFGAHERAAIDAALGERPDLLLLPGDYVQLVDEAAHEATRGELAAYLREVGFAAPLGAYAVEGNVDRTTWTEIFAGLPVTTFRTTDTVVGDEVAVTGLSLGDSFDPRLRVAGRPDRLHIVVGHAPDFSLGDIDADLLVAGHTHGGQVRLPLVGPLLTLSRVPRERAAGLTARPGGGVLVVSRGVGMERGHAPRLRFLCRPEVVVLDVVPE